MLLKWPSTSPSQQSFSSTGWLGGIQRLISLLRPVSLFVHCSMLVLEAHIIYTSSSPHECSLMMHTVPSES